MLGFWSPRDCQLEILRLQRHLGFPNGLQLLDPVINADKFEYLCAAQTICLPSLKIPLLHDDNKLAEVMETLKKFIKKYTDYDGEGSGFIIKAPYVQNKQGFHMRNFKDYDSFIKIFLGIYTSRSKSLSYIAAEVFPYLIVQPKVLSTNESKIVLWDGEAKYLSTSSEFRGISNKKKTPKELKDFAESALKLLKKRTNNVIVSNGHFRVDLFCKVDGTLVVNEFESLDAYYNSGNTDDMITFTNITNYYVAILSNLIKSNNYLSILGTINNTIIQN